MELTPVISRPRRAAIGPCRSFTAESLESRRLLTVTLNQPIGNVSFAQDSGPEKVDLYALFADTNGNADLQFTATSSVPSVASTAIVGNTLTVNPTPGRSGFTLVKMVATDPNGVRSVDVFRVQIKALPARSLDVTLDAKHRSVTFVQADHARATISISGPGTAVVHLGGDGLKLSGAVVQGSHIEMESATLSNTTGKSHLTVIGARSGGGQAMIGNIIVNDSLGSLDVHKAVLIGDVAVTKALGTVNIDTAQNGAISVGSGSTRLALGTAVDEVFSSSGSVSFLQNTQWIDSDNVPESFVAAALHGANVRGNFMPGLSVTGTGVKGRALDHFKVRGQISGSWSIQGTTGTIDVGNFGQGFQGQFKAISQIKTEGNFTGQLIADSIGQMNIRGAISFGTIELTGTGRTVLHSLTAASADVFALYSNGSIGSITSGFLFYTTIYAGVGHIASGQVLPSVASDFSSISRIASIRTHPKAKLTGFSASQIAAAKLGTLSFGTTNTKDAGQVFGIAAESIESLSMRDKGRPQTFTLRKIHTDAALQSAIKANKWTLGDLSLRIL